MHDAPFSFEQIGGVGAKIRPGRGGPSGEDVIFMDLRKGLFAVADGAGRASGASHRFMAKFARMVLGFRGIRLGPNPKVERDARGLRAVQNVH